MKDKRKTPKEHQENETGIVPGRKPVLELLATSPDRVDTVFLIQAGKSPDRGRIMDACKQAGVRYSLVPRENLDRLFDGNHQGVVARVFEAGFADWETMLEQAPKEPMPVIVALDQVQDTGNVGTLARTLYGLGGAGLVVTKHNSGVLSGRAMKTSAGALLNLPVAKVTNLSRALDEAKERGYAIYGADAGEGGENLYQAEIRFPAVLVLGNEKKGIRPNVLNRCDSTVYVPLNRAIDSLNVAQAGAVILGRFLEKCG